MRLAKLLILSTCLTGFSVAVQAQSCTVRPDCETLGYNRTETDCAGYKMLRCPFDSTAVFCGGDLCPNAVTCTSPATCAETCELDSNICVRCQMPDRGEFFDGRGNTAAIIAQTGTSGLAVTACNLFFPVLEGAAASDADFGQGKWYLPAMGEWIKTYGLSSGNAVTSSEGTSGIDASKGKTKVNNGLTTAGGTILGGRYWSSSEYNNAIVWTLNMTDGNREFKSKDDFQGIYVTYVRCFLLLENLVTADDTRPQIGDIMYSDKTWNSTKVSYKAPVGVVVDVYGSDITIVNLNDLGFSYRNSANNFNADSPYSGSYEYTDWATNKSDITTLNNYSPATVLTEIQNYQYW